MEYLGGGEIKWRNEQHQPILQVDQCRRICRDVILGLEYCASNQYGFSHFRIHPFLTIHPAQYTIRELSTVT
jgi:hypothetical protein